MMKRRGFSLIEALISMILVGGLLVAALNAVGYAKAGQHRLATRRQGRLLAEDLRTEINLQPFQAPGTPEGMLATIGPAGHEMGPDRSRFNDADDYDKWSSSPPQLQDGTAIPWAANFTRSVSVKWSYFFSPHTTTATPTGMKLFQIEVHYYDRLVASIQWVRSVYDKPVWSQRQAGW
ncbi:MAG: prepilin-type N-terminal cleavage/methylation domain-containing protein [Phycisphaerae bacterium]